MPRDDDLQDVLMCKRSSGAQGGGVTAFRKVSVLAELVDDPRPDGELLGYLGHQK
jgi:hypothetical protein